MVKLITMFNPNSLYKRSFLFLLGSMVLLNSCYKPKAKFMLTGGNYVLSLRTQEAAAQLPITCLAQIPSVRIIKPFLLPEMV